ncbi:GNAT family N-acetyltransferase [Nocardioides sp.]|uniref:GNAT family N-acetyltransferase n=1 Tax=Nocardioides sp. TaxID=35761 RepID=UPI003565281B
MDTHPDLTFATLDPNDDAGQRGEWLLGYGQAVARAFHQDRMAEKAREFWLEHCRRDAAVLRGAWLTSPAVGPGTLPVATFTHFDKELNAGLAQLPVRMITDVTVSPTHRRRGLLRRLMTENLQDAVEAGLPMAALTASEGSIYGRFGFGVATHQQRVEVDARTGLPMRPEVAAAPAVGRVELVEPADAWACVDAVFSQFHVQTRGSLPRPQFYESILTGTFDWDSQSPDAKLRAAIHVDDRGRPIGHVLYKHVGQQDGHSTVDVVDLVATDPSSYLRLWRFLADIDLVDQVRWNRAPLTDPLAWALVDPRLRRVVKVVDDLWVRVLDVVRALEARPWGADGEIVLEVEDELGHAAGRWRVAVKDGQAQVSATQEPADVALAADTLGSVHLGGVGVTTLGAAGRLRGEPLAVERFAAMADVGPAPYCITGF